MRAALIGAIVLTALTAAPAAVAVRSRGDALVAWIQQAGERRRIAVARRAPGAPSARCKG